MPLARPLIHVVADFGTSRESSDQALAFRDLLEPHAEVACWSTGNLPGGRGIRPIRAFGGDLPRGGTLLLAGPRQPLSPWIEHCRAGRIIAWCDGFDPEALFRLLGQCRRLGLPDPEPAFPARGLMAAHGVAGTLVPPLVEWREFSRSGTASLPTAGHHAFDHPPDAREAALYRSWALKGIDVRLRGGATLPPFEGITLAPRSAGTTADFLSGLDIFFCPPLATPAPRVLLEAMAAGCAVVAGGACGEEWIAEGVSGYRAASLDQAFDRVMALAGDAALRRRLGAAARERAGEAAGPGIRESVARWLLDQGPVRV